MCGVVIKILKEEEKKNREKQREKPTEATAKYRKGNCCFSL